uniref:DUF4200 domain-containing protein n=1 Tax=Leptocylindrus danicus TaxID=163516 RepID=A0A7S2PSX9_9STRA|mmetsp:Transcript_970/g.1365  ORF Transcript_970/g.1365 Transcript_970/m.1365 type:complete len:537 (+) Transcript_970:209-1819(+)|eukprot:CAMPEP_0116008244 /NCGR_PEP_ID=MMETSP0321-20121206/2755_1 /TAXON_ID=163516 /ORGANISM="Leptocylindrus danicus var. danicus, Strain B650" /LENGTH=536 /DNA_ID=CAMNT_0003477045 /DNA_START=162 /DNA_END=1772 /DNA_ORIENTATION=-
MKTNTDSKEKPGDILHMNPFRIVKENNGEDMTCSSNHEIDGHGHAESEEPQNEIAASTSARPTFRSQKLSKTVRRKTKSKALDSRQIKYNKENENLSDFIAKKRAMFFLQMSIDTKNDEIRKMEERAQAKEDALKRSEQILEEDAIRFDAFLKENDKKAQSMIRKAELETKLKLEKAHEVKRLKQQIQTVQADINKNKGILEDCIRYKSFLDELTPNEWFEEQKEEKRKRQAERRRQRIKKRKDKWRDEQKKELEANKEKDEHVVDSKNARVSIHVLKKRSKENASPSHDKNDMPEPDFEDEPLTSSDEELPMYFQRPHQLLDVFLALEEENLFLIQNSQESEQILDGLRRKFDKTKIQIDDKAKDLDDAICHLQNKIKEEEGRQCENMRPEMIEGGDSNSNLLHELGCKVQDIYKRCNLGDPGSNPCTLAMLSDIEARAEDILQSIEKLPQAYVRCAEKEKEKKRRLIKRAQQQAALEKAQEERNRKAIERSLQPAKKRTGKPIMFRSNLVKAKSNCTKMKEVTKEELDEIRHLT